MVKELSDYPHPSRPGFEPENTDPVVPAEVAAEIPSGSEGIVVDLESARAARNEKLHAQRKRYEEAGLIPKSSQGNKPPLWQIDNTKVARSPETEMKPGLLDTARVVWLGAKKFFAGRRNIGRSE